MKRFLIILLIISSSAAGLMILPSSVYAVKPAYTAPAWIRTGGPLGGLGYDIRYNFTNPNVWYATDAWAGLHMSTDNGITWFPSNSGINIKFGPAGDTITIFSATVDPLDPDIVWIGTQYTGQIFRSTDGGVHWEEKVNGIDQKLLPLSFRGFTIDPRSSNIVYAMAEIASAGWTPDGSERKGIAQDLTKGIVYKTIDGGESWTEIWRGDHLARYCWIDPRNPDVLYFSTGIFDREAANSNIKETYPEGAGGVGILKSTDGGATWDEINRENGLLDLYVGSLFMHPENPDVLLAAASSDSWWNLGSNETSGVFLTENGGEKWSRVLAGEIFTSVEFCTSDTQVAYAGSSEAIYRSNDRGHTWQRFGRPDNTWGSPGVIAGWPIDMQCDPRNPLRIFVNNYLGGNFLSTDGGQTWESVSKGYTGESVYAVAAAPGRPWTVLSGGRVGVFRSDNGGGDWKGLAYPPAGTALRLNEIITVSVDPSDANHLLAAPMDAHALVGSYDGGQSWSVVPVPGSALSPVDLSFGLSNASIVYAAIAPFNCTISPTMNAADCNVPGTGVFISEDGGVSWKSANGTANELLNTAVLAVAADPQNDSVAYAATYSRRVFKTTDRGKTWTPHSEGLLEVPILDLAIDPDNPDVIFAGTAGASVYRSTNGGESWNWSGAGLNPETMVRSMAFDTTNTNTIYAGDYSSGVYVSTDGGGNWFPIKNGLDHRAVTSLALSDDGSVLYAGIHGAGVYRLGGLDVVWDVKACEFPNAFNCKRRQGVVPLTIYGGPDIDANAIDISSLKLSKAAEPDNNISALTLNKTISDVGSPADLNAEVCGIPDSYPDLTVAFQAGELAALIQCPLEKGEESVKLILQGVMNDGTPIIPVNIQVMTNVSK